MPDQQSRHRSGGRSSGRSGVDRCWRSRRFIWDRIRYRKLLLLLLLLKRRRRKERVLLLLMRLRRRKIWPEIGHFWGFFLFSSLCRQSFPESLRFENPLRRAHVSAVTHLGHARSAWSYSQPGAGQRAGPYPGAACARSNTIHARLLGHAGWLYEAANWAFLWALHMNFIHWLFSTYKIHLHIEITLIW